jgi:hypothetical protein
MRAARLLITVAETPQERRIGRHVITRVDLTSSLLINSRAAAFTLALLRGPKRHSRAPAHAAIQHFCTTFQLSTVASSVPASHPYVAGHGLLAG